MKPEKKVKIQKAAKILLALGDENAASVLQYLEPEEMESIVAEILKIDHIESNEKVALLEEFKSQIDEQRDLLSGGKDKAKKLIINALGQEKAQKYLDKLDDSTILLSFKKLENYQEKHVSLALSEELPQTAAVVLSQFSAAYAAGVIKLFEPMFAARTAKRIAGLDKISPEALKAVYNSLEEKLKKMQANSIDDSDGEGRLTAILEHMDIEGENSILTSLDDDDPVLAERIRSGLFSFEDLANLNAAEVRKVVENIDDIEIWAKALKGTSQEFLRFILSCLSVNRSNDIIEEMEFVGPITLAEIDQNRTRIQGVAEILDKKREIILRKHKEKMTE